MPTWSFLFIQDNASPITEQLSFFHDHTIIIIVIITILTLYILVSCLFRRNYNKFFLEGQELETIWTVLPGVLLIFIALPSIKILYLIEETKNPSLTIKVTGHQWYWSYEYTDIINFDIDVFIENSNTNRLLNCRRNLPIPCKQNTRILTTSTDVIHSWALPSIGVKVDANPGRLNQTFIYPKRLGLFFGQCSEICGANHSFIPICLEVTFPSLVINFLKNS